MKTAAICLLSTLVAISGGAQKLKDGDVPQAVRNSFTKAYPSVKTVKWEKEEAKFEANFEVNKAETSVVLSENGEIEEVETEITQSQLPKSVAEALAKDFSGYKVKESEKILVKGVTSYETELTKAGKTIEVLFDANGKALKQEEKKSKAEKD